MVTLNHSCPCQILTNTVPLTQNNSQPSYANCCQPLHQSLQTGQQFAQTAEQLMRSRYSAFVLQNIDYIVATTLPSQQPLLDILAIKTWAQETNWSGLEIISHNPQIGKRHAQVEFKAYFTTAEGLQCHHELSAFVKIKVKSSDESAKNAKEKTLEKWFFIDPTVDMVISGKAISQKQPCICGSGEKFKRCCGRFL
ncbi:YchJ family protein [Psychrobacter sp. I-STPA10]|uniref:YchJ family protein n=1 Tax=Psychrobacter sp. I-STPA10 TaxID=2585769 RepID=UPI001E3421E2|nr:YchJ family protein [Psychrobacter sp. I-STPA10]